MRVEPALVDASRFETLAAHGRQAREDKRWGEASTHLQEALSLWRGDPYAELGACSEAAMERRRLASRRLDIQDDLSEAQLALGRHEALIPELEALVAEQPTRERRAAHLMLALYRTGRQTEALEVYARTRDALVTNLGLEPGPELQDLQRRILQHDPALGKPAGAPPSASAQRAEPPAGSTKRRAVLLAAALGLAVAVSAIVVLKVRGRATTSTSAPANSVAIVDQRRGRVIGSAPTGSRPVNVVLADGSAWIANEEDATVTQVDVESRRVVRTIGIGFEPTGLAGANGAVWVVGGFDHRLSRIDTSDGGVRLRLRLRERLGPLPPGYERGPAGVAVGPDGIWVSHGIELTRFDPRTGAVERTIRAGGPWVSQIAVGEGKLWVAYDGKLSPVGVSQRTPAVEAVALGVHARKTRIRLIGLATNISIGDGYAWVAIGRADTVWRIDPEALTVSATMQAGDSPAGLAVEDGVWISNRTDATVTRIDPGGEKLDVIPVGHTLEGLAAADGEVWVAVRAP
jgi:DNA-binding beta-propeller fold protein YncE